jgi:hypothetical protein
MTLDKIFAEVGMNAEQIGATAQGVAVPAEQPVTTAREVFRPRCLVCGRPIGAQTCKLERRRAALLSNDAPTQAQS